MSAGTEASSLAPAARAVTRIEPSRALVPVNLGELWEYRSLLYLLVWREVKVRYKQTALGVAWAVIQPVMTMTVFSIFFGRLGGMPSDGFPYPVFAYCALLPWQLFSFAMTEASNSLVANQRLVSKVYFPRLVLPMASVVVGLVDFGISFGVLAAMMAYYGIMPGVAILTLPLWTLLAVGTALSMGLWLSALNVQYRDVRYTLPFFTQLWMFATPVAYSSSLVPPMWRTLYGLNPMVGVVEGFRWALLGSTTSPGSIVAVSVAAVIMLMTGGLFYFRKTERTFADVV
ncbi:MAG: ABC transporter permease [Vicinamibacterales bacterium]